MMRMPLFSRHLDSVRIDWTSVATLQPENHTARKKTLIQFGGVWEWLWHRFAGTSNWLIWSLILSSSAFISRSVFTNWICSLTISLKLCDGRFLFVVILLLESHRALLYFYVYWIYICFDILSLSIASTNANAKLNRITYATVAFHHVSNEAQYW